MYHYRFLNAFSLFEILGCSFFFYLFYGYTFLSAFIVCGDSAFLFLIICIDLTRYFNVGHFYVESGFFNL